ncbi:putative short-chain type dehydrogenase/reductase y4lA [Asanoa ishikariensis]|uniref:NAD(P)-dependent dehydrogenase, short-chain alcohol dehydrogenase family n=1 Tax=Asanoa ishikariensis TaxID=137265 RepID=A0A1H3MS89_9ACTN|nr:SDR family oxidoreductase [Asanoa ishikariensis]GIF66302.1 putative short-chain type dehydrogenase/reductase y4lA [Asanoa ishikariensis]SDY79360.1 NAD(P)-dependent dehydrogenase, short-chain alcohol dehydrogenase family [Asanoa ishikariensis]
MRGLKDKVAIVAGAAPKNIGGATAVRLAEEGMTVVAADLSAAAAEAVAEEIRAAGGKAVGRGFDITDEESYRDLIESTTRAYGRLDGLLNVAADLSAESFGRDSDALSVPIEVWRHTIDVTLTGYLYGIRHALPIMIKQGGGSIVNTMSSAVWMGEPVHVAYQAAKSGLVGLTRHTATLGGKHGVRTNLLSPGVILTGTAYARTTQEFRDEILASVRSPRLGHPEDLAAMVAFLFSDDAAYVNGQSLLVDGGANFT